MMECLLHEDFTMEWEDRESLNKLIDGDGINNSIWDLTMTNLWEELYFFLQDQSILSYNQLNIAYYSKKNGNTIVLLDATGIDDEKLSMDEFEIEDYLKNHFSRITSVDFDRIPKYWKLTIKEDLVNSKNEERR